MAITVNKIGSEFYATAASEEEAIAAVRARIAQPREEIDWKEALMRILDAVAMAEGVWFESHWKLTDEEKKQVDLAYHDWYMNPENKARHE